MLHTVDHVNFSCQKPADLASFFTNLYLPIMLTYEWDIKSSDLLNVDTITSSPGNSD